jgi:(2Fe-2S) ferredoxin
VTAVLVCRGCCCGTADKHPDVDHDAHLARIRSAVSASASTRLWTTGCLGPCERSNVVVVRTGTGRRWFGDVLTDDAVRGLADWLAAGTPPRLPAPLAARQFLPSLPPPIVARPLARHGEALADLVEHILVGGAGGWSLGVHGAGAEFSYDGDQPDVRRSGNTMESVTARGGIRLAITDTTGAFVVELPGTDVVGALVLAVARSSLPSPAETLTARGADRNALRCQDNTAQLFDLGIGHAAAAFCVRTADDELRSMLERAGGKQWRDVLDQIGSALVERSPHRVVETALGRVEVYAPIPPDGSPSPPGPHSHLLPGELEIGDELPSIFALPPGWAPAGVFYPPPGWQLPRDGDSA